MQKLELKQGVVPSPKENSLRDIARLSKRAGASLLLTALFTGGGAMAQVNVVTAHNDIARTGQNLNETNLKLSNVNATQFGKIFSQSVKGLIYGQPLYLSQVAIPNKGTHNVVYVATNYDYVYAFDADNNGGVNATPLWQVSLLTNSAPAGTYVDQYGVTGTPVIDPVSKTMYLASSELKGSEWIFRLHALDVTTGAEKFGAPLLVQASVPGTGSGSANGTMSFNAAVTKQRPGLLLLNGILYVAFGSRDDQGPWHGWVLSYNASTLQPIDVFCTTANGVGGGIWMGGSGLAAEVNDPNKPYGRILVTTGNGTFGASKPYTNTMDYGMSVLDLDLTGGKITVEDEFTPFNESLLNSEDGDLGSGGVVILPSQTTASGKTLQPMVQVGKSGMIYILDRNNLGGFNTTTDNVAQELQTPEYKGTWGNGIWGSEAYWNNHIYFGGTNPGSGYAFDPNAPTGPGSNLVAYSFVNGVLSSTPTSQTAQEFFYPGPTPSISANGNSNAILWAFDHDTSNLNLGVLLAYDASNLANLLYSSNTNQSRDYPGASVEYTVPTIANGKVYVGAQSVFSVYGLLAQTPTVATPVISPPGATFTGSQIVKITDTTPGAQIYYTINGSLPTVSSTLYNPTKGITVTSNETITAIASATGYLQGTAASAIFSSTANAANPVFSLAAGTYSGKQALTLTDATASAKIYYTVDGSTPTSASIPYTGKFSVPISETVQAIAIAPSLLPSSIISAAYVIEPTYTIDFSQGFSGSSESGLMQFNGSTDLDDFRLQLTNGKTNEAGSAFYTTAVPIWAFTTDFTFQLSNPLGDGITFTIQGDAPTALGANAQNLGYGGIRNSIAIKFSMHGDAGQGNDSTGLYVNGVAPTVPSIDLTNTGIHLGSGDYFNVHLTYDDKNLNMTITDALTLATWSHSWVVNIPTHIGASTGYVGFTGGTGGSTSSEKIDAWTYLAGIPSVPNYPAGFDPVNGSNILAMNGNAALSGTILEMTTGAVNQASSAYYTTPVAVTAFTTDFDFKVNKGSTATFGDGFTLVIQNAGPTALGTNAGGLGYATIPNSVAIKFDFFNTAGEGTDSTGVFVNGAMPTVPAINLSSHDLQLNDGDTMHAHVTYDGTTLSWTLQTPGSFAGSLPINIPETIGSNTAYIGFTGASGTAASVIKILDWTFSNP